MPSNATKIEYVIETRRRKGKNQNELNATPRKLGLKHSNSEHWREKKRSSLSMVKSSNDTSPNHPW
jgi:hypothetical protein